MWPVAMEEAVREREKPCMRLCDTSLTSCRRCGEEGEEEEEEGALGSPVVSRVQTVTVHIFRCAHYPVWAWREAGGFPRGCDWVRTRLAGFARPDSASAMMEVFFLQRLGGRRKKQQKKKNELRRLKC